MSDFAPEDLYFLKLRQLFQDHGTKGGVRLFDAWPGEMRAIVNQELTKLVPSDHFADAGYVKKIVESLHEQAVMRSPSDSPVKTVFMPAGSFAQDIARALDPSLYDIVGFLDNFKSGQTTCGTWQVLNPAACEAMDFDAVILATPSYGVQAAMARQMEQIIGDKARIIKTGDITLQAKIETLLQTSDDTVVNALRAIEAVVPQDSRTVVFAVPSFPAHYIGHVRALRRKGVRVVLLSLSPEIMYGPSVREYGRAFDVAVTTENNLLAFFHIVRQLKNCSLYAVDYSLFNWLALLIRDLFSGKMVLEVYDLSDNAGYSKGRGVKNAEKGSGVDLFDLENHARGMVYQTVDGIVFRDSPALMEKAKKLFGITTPSLRFLPYPERCDTLKELDGEEHIVFSGHILNAPDELVYSVLSLARQVAAQGIHMHFFNPADPMGTALPDFISAAEQNRYIHYHRPIAAEFHNQVMRLYNWGWLVYDFSNQSDEDIERHAYTFTSRLLSYVNAGLPVICSEESTYQVEVIREYGIGIVTNSRNVGSLNQIISECDYDGMVKNVLALRKRWDIKTAVNDLISFIF